MEEKLTLLDALDTLEKKQKELQDRKKKAETPKLLKNVVHGFSRLLKRQDCNIDSAVSKLHYRLTTTLLWLAVFTMELVFFRDTPRIRCTHSRAEDKRATNEHLNHVMNNFCYHLGLHVLPRHYFTNDTTGNGEVQYAGVGPLGVDDQVTSLSWYQWVPYAFALQAMSFYMPRYFWKYLLEERLISKMVRYYRALDIVHASVKPSMMQYVSTSVVKRVKEYPRWGYYLIACEVLYLANLLIQWFLTDWFLQGNFWNLGYAVTKDMVSESTQFSTLDIAFPKMAKCVLRDFGHTGQIQENDMVCVLESNVYYEKVYLILWAWYIVLLSITAISLVHEVVNWIMYNRKWRMNHVELEAKDGVVDVRQDEVEQIRKNYSYSEWMFVQYLMKNVKKTHAKQLINDLTQSDSHTEELLNAETNTDSLLYSESSSSESLLSTESSSSSSSSLMYPEFAPTESREDPEYPKRNTVRVTSI